MLNGHYLSDGDFEAIGIAIDHHVELIEDVFNLTIDTSVDWDRWNEIRETAEGLPRSAVNVDPTQGNVGNWNSFYLCCEDEAGEVVALLLQKRLEFEDLLQEFRSHHFFHDARPRLKHYPLQLTDEARELPPIGGVFSMGGGMWVHPKYRGADPETGLRLSNVMPPIGRWLCLRDWPIDGHVSIVLSSPDRKNWVREGLGTKHTIPLFTGMYPDKDVELNFSLNFNPRDFILDQVHEAADSVMGMRGLPAVG